MKPRLSFFIAVWCALAALYTGAAAQARSGGMSFFVTSSGLGNGGNLGGLEGADCHCQSLAEAAGAGPRTWRAYLSTQGPTAVNARERIGRGPWINAKGVVIAKDLAENGPSHACLSNLRRGIACEVGGPPNMHDMLTGTQPDGMAFPAGRDMTCGNWTKSGSGAAMLGHSDRTGLDESAPMKSWNSSHPSRGPGGGCSQDDLKSTGGYGLFYCLATN